MLNFAKPSRVSANQAKIGDYYLVRNCTMRLVSVEHHEMVYQQVLSFKFKTIGPINDESHYFEQMFHPNDTLDLALGVLEVTALQLQLLGLG